MVVYYLQPKTCCSKLFVCVSTLLFMFTFRTFSLHCSGNLYKLLHVNMCMQCKPMENITIQKAMSMKTGYSFVLLTLYPQTLGKCLSNISISRSICQIDQWMNKRAKQTKMRGGVYFNSITSVYSAFILAVLSACFPVVTWYLLHSQIPYHTTPHSRGEKGPFFLIH